MYLRMFAFVLLTLCASPKSSAYEFMSSFLDYTGDKTFYKYPIYPYQKTAVIHPNDSRTPWKSLSTYWDTGWRMIIGEQYGYYKCYHIKRIGVRDAIVPGGAGVFKLTMSPFDFVGPSKTWTINLGVRDEDYELEPFNLGCHYGRVQLQAEFSPTNDVSTRGPVHRGFCNYGYCRSTIRVGLTVDLAGWADKYITFAHYFDGYDLYPSAVRWSPDIISMTRADEWVSTTLQFGYDGNVAVDDGPTTTCTFNAVGDACSMIEARTSWGSNAVFPISDIPDLDVQRGDPVRQLYLRGVKGKVGSGVCGLNATLTYR